MAHRLGLLLVLCCVRCATPSQAQVLEGFTWVNQKSDTATMESVAHILRYEDYTSILDVGYLAPPAPVAANGAESTTTAIAPIASALLEHDSHVLAVVANRPNATALPQEETMTLYDLSLKYGLATPLLKGAALHFVGWLRFTREDQPELVATYQDCAGPCQKTTFFTAIYLDQKTHEWKARWPRSISGAPLFSEGQEANGGQQVYSLMVDDTGRAVMGTWQHYAGRTGRNSDYVFAYHLTQWTQQDVTEQLEGAQAKTMQQRLCHAQDEALALGGGQESAMCKVPAPHKAAAMPHHKH